VTGVTILQGDGSLAVEIEHSRGSHTGLLRWDQPPSLRRVAGVMLVHLGRSITSLGDLDIPGFYGSELRQHARQLLRFPFRGRLADFYLHETRRRGRRGKGEVTPAQPGTKKRRRQKERSLLSKSPRTV
jgi:hypothetical protein